MNLSKAKVLFGAGVVVGAAAASGAPKRLRNLKNRLDVSIQKRKARRAGEAAARQERPD